MSQSCILLCVVNHGQAEAMLSELRPFHIQGGLVLQGEGTYRNKILSFLGLDQTRKEVLLLPVDQAFLPAIFAMMEEHFQLNKKSRGIAITLPLSRINQEELLGRDERLDPDGFDQACLFVITDQGRSRDVVEAAAEAGCYGGTIIHGRGAGLPLHLAFDPQRDMVWFLVETDKVYDLADALLEVPFEGQAPDLVVLPVYSAAGLSTFGSMPEDKEKEDPQPFLTTNPTNGVSS